MKEAACAKVLRCEEHGMHGKWQVLWFTSRGPQGATEGAKGDSVGEVRQEPVDERSEYHAKGFRLHLRLKGVKAKVKWMVVQFCLTLCDPIDYTVHEILQARTLEWVAFPFSRGSSQPRDQIQVSQIAGGFFTS